MLIERFRWEKECLADEKWYLEHQAKVIGDSIGKNGLKDNGIATKPGQPAGTAQIVESNAQL